MNYIQKVMDRAKQKVAPKPPKPDPDMAQVAHFVHAMTLATPAVRQMVRRYSRKLWGEIPPESSLPALPTLPK